jgi:hypothetical protein
VVKLSSAACRRRLGISNETGDLNLPKLFSRQIGYEVRKNAGETIGSFVEYLKIRNDECFHTTEFL